MPLPYLLGGFHEQNRTLRKDPVVLGNCVPPAVLTVLRVVLESFDHVSGRSVLEVRTLFQIELLLDVVELLVDFLALRQQGLELGSLLLVLLSVGHETGVQPVTNSVVLPRHRATAESSFIDLL